MKLTINAPVRGTSHRHSSGNARGGRDARVLRENARHETGDSTTNSRVHWALLLGNTLCRVFSHGVETSGRAEEELFRTAASCVRARYRRIRNEMSTHRARTNVLDLHRELWHLVGYNVRITHIRKGTVWWRGVEMASHVPSFGTDHTDSTAPTDVPKKAPVA
jgi:hypothetical protein